MSNVYTYHVTLCLLVVSVYVAHARNSFDYFRTVVVNIAFGLLSVAAFLESSS